MPRRRSPIQRWTDKDRRAILGQLDSSGLGVKEFGEAAGVSWSTLYEWRRRFALEDGGDPAFATSGLAGVAADGGRSEFAEVRVISNTTGDRDRQRWDLDGALRRLSGWLAGLVECWPGESFWASSEAVDK